MDTGFDLNIEKVLENWEISHAIREIIANALDEQLLTNTAPIEINQKGIAWVIRDYGRGLQYKHLTQNENEEKLSAPNLIGKFGVGLKDALATFNRHKIQVEIQSKYGVFTFGEMKKSGFEDIVTLHAIIQEPKDIEFVGTEFHISDCTVQDISAAKKMFLRFSSEELLEQTPIGEIYQKDGQYSNIYINGVLVAHEENFLYSYNITSLNAQIKKALNRERTNVGRTAYTPRIKEILLKCENPHVIKTLAANLHTFGSGELKDELKWNDVAIHAAKALNAQENVVFVTPRQMQEMTSNQRDILDQSGKDYIVIPDNIFYKLHNETDLDGQRIGTADSVFEGYRESFQYHFVSYGALSAAEKKVFDTAEWTCRFCNATQYLGKIAISETIRPTPLGDDVLGEWDATTQKIVIRRDQLQSERAFLGTLIH